jgi:hypothetical protein
MPRAKLQRLQTPREVRADHAVHQRFAVRNVLERAEHAVVLQASKVGRTLPVAPAVQLFEGVGQSQVKPRLEILEHFVGDTRLQGLEVLGAVLAQPTLETVQ